MTERIPPPLYARERPTGEPAPAASMWTHPPGSPEMIQRLQDPQPGRTQ